MPLHYVRVSAQLDAFSPLIRPTGNMVVIGDASAGAAANTAFEITSLADARSFSADPNALSPLSKALIAATRQTPGPSRIWGIRTGTTATAVADALTVAEGLNVQFVVVAGASLTADATKQAPITALVNHVTTVSTRGDGNERMGVAMLAKGATDTTVAGGTFSNDRMVYVAHQSDDDVAAAVAGTIAGYPPHISMILKQVAITNTPFTAAQIDTINGLEPDTSSKIGGAGVIWLASPTLIPGTATYLGEGYNGNPGGQVRFIDVQRTLDDITFKIKARLIGTIGNLRISRSGLRSLTLALEGVLNPLVSDGVLERFAIDIPILRLLDADPATLTDDQLSKIHDAENGRVAQVLVSVEYAGAIHRINVNLKFN
ncbi:MULTISPECIES: hypothetical protein [unclassified Nocardia]|uniref:hypothetical protein n=1 Tax=unclassified Nocardia TaxID=2637762 RepID=UPI001CE47F25|nr:MULTISPECIES: hypothetical protein [unclassified Nocardia]